MPLIVIPFSNDLPRRWYSPTLFRLFPAPNNPCSCQLLLRVHTSSAVRCRTFLQGYYTNSHGNHAIALTAPEEALVLELVLRLSTTAVAITEV